MIVFIGSLSIPARGWLGSRILNAKELKCRVPNVGSHLPRPIVNFCAQRYSVCASRMKNQKAALSLGSP
jgi:hypothetical protein